MYSPDQFSDEKYEATYWPSRGELLLLLQGIDPWCGNASTLSMLWLQSVGPYLAIPRLTSTYCGDTDMPATKLASLAGGSTAQAFRDSWMGRTKETQSRRKYLAEYRKKQGPQRSWLDWFRG